MVSLLCQISEEEQQRVLIQVQHESVAMLTRRTVAWKLTGRRTNVASCYIRPP